MGLDVDGPGNDKGLYGIVPVNRKTTIGNENVHSLEFLRRRTSQQAFWFHVPDLA